LLSRGAHPRRPAAGAGGRRRQNTSGPMERVFCRAGNTDRQHRCFVRATADGNVFHVEPREKKEFCLPRNYSSAFAAPGVLSREPFLLLHRRFFGGYRLCKNRGAARGTRGERTRPPDCAKQTKKKLPGGSRPTGLSFTVLMPSSAYQGASRSTISGPAGSLRGDWEQAGGCGPPRFQTNSFLFAGRSRKPRDFHFRRSARFGAPGPLDISRGRRFGAGARSIRRGSKKKQTLFGPKPAGGWGGGWARPKFLASPGRGTRDGQGPRWPELRRQRKGGGGGGPTTRKSVEE